MQKSIIIGKSNLKSDVRNLLIEIVDAEGS